MHSLPIFMKISGRRCVVIGGGDVATRKVKMLLKAGGDVEVISPTLDSELASMLAAGQIQYAQAIFMQEQLDGAVLVIAATDDEEVNVAVSVAAKAHNIPVNVVDAPELCTFTMPAIVDRSPIVIAISSGGASPVLARMIRAKIETLIPATYGQLSNLAAEFRDRVKQRFETTQARRIFWEKIFHGNIAELVLSGQEPAARVALSHAIEAEDISQTHGEVYLVGGGPGDPDLLTFRALRLMQQCDVCVYDKLVSNEVMALVRRDAELIYVGKVRDRHTLPQEEINQLLVRLAKEGKRVLRLKGGDPFIFGRGGEEIETLMENGVSFQVVPGITAANGISSYAGIPLTHRDYAQSCVFTTGHLKDGTVELDWVSLTRPNQTVVIYMGLVGLAQICEKLIVHGLPATMPVAVVQQGTTQQQRVVVADLATLADKVEAAGLEPPCLTIVGEVVNLRSKLSWFTPLGQN
jgi:uroporphyrin-III C-methyltransferase / precorrin-2 dehydrogenase / sirohydrochlorin ferrochelatase